MGTASVGGQDASRGQPGDARDDGLEREVKQGIVAAGGHLAWSARAVEAFVLAVAGRPLHQCRHRELNRVLVAYLELAQMLREVAVQPRDGAVAEPRPGGRPAC